jgi:hypothetical protein
MKLILLSHSPIKATKTGKEYDKFQALTEKGQVLDQFMSRAEFQALNLKEDDFLSKEDLKDVFNTYAPVNASFDFQGKIESIEK